MYKGTIVKFIADFSSETMEARKQWDSGWKVQKE